MSSPLCLFPSNLLCLTANLPPCSGKCHAWHLETTLVSCTFWAIFWVFLGVPILLSLKIQIGKFLWKCSSSWDTWSGCTRMCWIVLHKSSSYRLNMLVSFSIERLSECQNRKWLLWLANSRDVLLTGEGILYISDPNTAAVCTWVCIICLGMLLSCR